MSTVKRALLSVHDKTGVVDFAKGLASLGVEILSTGGTAKLLRDSGVPVVDVAQVTGFPEMLDGRVKTLHPKVHGGLLFIRGNSEHEAAIKKHGVKPIDLVVVNLYPFERTVSQPDVSLHDAIERQERVHRELSHRPSFLTPRRPRVISLLGGVRSLPGDCFQRFEAARRGQLFSRCLRRPKRATAGDERTRR